MAECRAGDPSTGGGKVSREHSLRVVSIADIARRRDAEARRLPSAADLNVEFLVRERNAARVDAALWRVVAVSGWLTFAVYFAVKVIG